MLDEILQSEEALNEAGFSISKCRGWMCQNAVEFEKYSSYGRDFTFTIEGDSYDEFIENMREYYDNFDISYETYLYLDDEGHGANGAPYDMLDVYRDTEECAGFIEEALRIIEEHHQEEQNAQM